MNRSKKIIILAHCILNQNSVVLPYAREMKVFNAFISKCLNDNIGIIQLPCPELKIYGIKRWGHVKDQFEHPGFKDFCKEELGKIVDQLKHYQDNGYKLLGVYGIKGSPSCGVNLTCRGNWCGEASNYENIEDISSRVKMVEESGIYMEIFREILINKNLELKFYDIEDSLC